MICNICNTPMQFICNTYSCGHCYYQELMSADIKSMRPPVGDIAQVYDEFKHMLVSKKVK